MSASSLYSSNKHALPACLLDFTNVKVGHTVTAGNAQVYLFQNYAMLQRAPDTCLKALERFTWQSFGLEVEVCAVSTLQPSVLHIKLVDELTCHELMSSMCPWTAITCQHSHVSNQVNP